ncbi:MAG: guanylate kinase, partial [Microvirga sp.]|nr:guanylate kinase [Microvirga sp.]
MSQDPKSPVGRRGLILILSSPSGAGKTTLTRSLVEERAGVLSVSVTTRPKRPSEIEGKHYHFIDVEEFKAMRDRDELLEWAEVHGNFYGTPRKPVEKTLASGQDMVFDIDYQGTRQVRGKLPDDVVTVFVLPPSFKELKARLERRGRVRLRDRQRGPRPFLPEPEGDSDRRAPQARSPRRPLGLRRRFALGEARLERRFRSDESQLVPAFVTGDGMPDQHIHQLALRQTTGLP